MNKFFKKITSVAISTVIAIGTLGAVANAAEMYEPVENWHINYMNGAPTNTPNLTPGFSCTIYIYGGKYRTKCESISGGNNRKVIVDAPEIKYEITTTGLSDPRQGGRDKDPNYITFNFSGSSSTSCVASGSVGYNKYPS